MAIVYWWFDDLGKLNGDMCRGYARAMARKCRTHFVYIVSLGVSDA